MKTCIRLLALMLPLPVYSQTGGDNIVIGKYFRESYNLVCMVTWRSDDCYSTRSEYGNCCNSWTSDITDQQAGEHWMSIIGIIFEKIFPAVY